MYIKRKLFAGVSALGVALAMSLTVGGALSGKKTVKAIRAETVDSYYSSITDSMEGETLKNALHDLNVAKRKSAVGYAGMRTFARYSDADPNGSGKIISFYDNQLIGPSWDNGKTWNREHVWPNIRGGNSVENDAHMIRPAATSTNSDRGSKGYGMSSYDPGKYVEYYRGSASRIIFYAAIANTSLNMTDNPLNFDGAGSFPNCMGSISEMLAWNLQYLPTGNYTGDNCIARDTEVRRNEVIQTHSSGQGNRNPFIDHPEYACRIWGNYNANTRRVCDSTPVPPDPGPGEMTSLELDVHEKTLAVGESFTLNATIEPSSLSSSVALDWFSSDDKIATVSSNGLVKGLKNGKVEITVCTTDMAFMDTCVVTVGSGKSPSSSSGSGCSGNIASTSIILSTLSLVGVSVLIYHKINKRKKNNV